MKKGYCVQSVEVYRQDIFVRAENPEQAIKEVQRGVGVEGELHYSHTLLPDEQGCDKWLVFEVK